MKGRQEDRAESSGGRMILVGNGTGAVGSCSCSRPNKPRDEGKTVGPIEIWCNDIRE